MSKKNSAGRRNFLRTAAAGAAGLVAAKPPVAMAQQAALKPETGSGAEVSANDKVGADFMVDVIKTLGIEYIAANPGSSFRGLQESFINYGGNKDPQYMLVMHEESGAAMCNGYAKIEGKPAMMCGHGTVGLQHAVMGIYDAFCDRVPVYMVIGNSLEPRTEVGNVHSAHDPAAIVRDMTKFDAAPVALDRFAEEAVRAYKFAMTPPTMPVVLTMDEELQVKPIGDQKLRIPKLGTMAPPSGDSGAVAAAAKMLASDCSTADSPEPQRS